MAAKILMTGSIMMDLILQMPRIPHPSESLLGTSYSNAGGGKGSNSAVAACKAGGEVSVCGTLGKDSNGEALLGMLTDIGIDVSNLTLERFKGLTILSPNETETEALVGILPKDDETCIAASKILKERSDCKYVVLKMGDKGSFIYGDDICQMVPTFKVEAVDPTAAGDCFTGVLVKQYAETKDIVASARYASAAAAISVQHLGAQPSLPTKEAIDEFIAARS